MYLNFRQISDWNAVELVVRATRPAASLAPDVRAVMKAFDPNLSATEFTTLEQTPDVQVKNDCLKCHRERQRTYREREKAKMFRVLSHVALTYHAPINGSPVS